MRDPLRSHGVEKSKEEVQAALGLKEPPDDAFMALLATVGDADVVLRPDARVLLRILATPAPETAAMMAARAKAEELFGPMPSRDM
jgi:hypothetical protein